MRFWRCPTASLLSRSQELPHQLEGNTKHLHFTPSRSLIQLIGSVGVWSKHHWRRGSEPYLIWPAPRPAGSPSLPPSHWQWPHGAPEELGTAGYSGKQKPWAVSRKGEGDNRKLTIQGVGFNLMLFTLDWTTEHRAAKQPNRSWDCSSDGHDCPLLLLHWGFFHWFL